MELKEKPPGVVSHVAALVVGVPFAAVGVLMTATFILAPIGIPILLLSAVPFYLVNKRRLTWMLQRDVPLETPEAAPWM